MSLLFDLFSVFFFPPYGRVPAVLTNHWLSFLTAVDFLLFFFFNAEIEFKLASRRPKFFELDESAFLFPLFW